jgi:hypothetical protein
VSDLEQQHEREEAEIAEQLGDDDQDVDEGAPGEGDERPGEGEELHADEAAIEANRDAEATLKKVSRKADNYVKGLVELLGPELGGYAGCTMCDGFPPGLVILEAIDDERRANVQRQLGIETLDDYETDEPFFTSCPTCNGRGRVRTGSKVTGKETEQCRKCGGRGFVTPTDQAQPAGGQPPVLVVAGDNGPPPERPAYDEFGTPSWHADYGKMVDMRDVPVSHWAGNLPTE